MQLKLIAVALMIVGSAWAQDACSKWPLSEAFKSKADCEEVLKISTEWNTSCTKADQKAGLWPENLSAEDQSIYYFCQIEEAKQTTATILSSHRGNPEVQDFWKEIRSSVLSHWEDTKDVFCMFHPSAVYRVEGDHIGAHCSSDARYTGVPDKKTMDKLFGEDEVVSANVTTFSSSLRCHDMPNPDDEKACLQRLVEMNKPLMDALKNQKK